MRVGLAQIDAWVGDLEGNVVRCTEAVAEAAGLGAQLVVLPEMAITGPFARDLLFDASFVSAAHEALDDLAQRLAGGPSALVGCAVREGPFLCKAVVLLERGRIAGYAGQRELRTDDVFHERRWFAPSAGSRHLSGDFGRLDCLDPHTLQNGVGTATVEGNLLVVSAALPFEPGAHTRRVRNARELGRPVVFVNACGAQDELVLEGRSFALGANGRLVASLARAREQIAVADLTAEALPAESEPVWEDEVCAVLEAGVGGFLRKNHIERAFVGLSGGVDSSVVGALAARALGPERVVGVAMPSRFSDPRSLECARALTGGLGIKLELVPIESLHAAALELLGKLVAKGTGAENLQARLRMVILMAFVNALGGVVLNTSNKTELATGYGTLYGDLAGGLSPIGDLTKPQVYRLARYLKSVGVAIPDFVLTRAPSAELRSGQVDPFDYDRLAPELECLVQENRSNGMLAGSEHKRRQGPVVLRVSSKAFGSGRMMPVTRR
jgi:NAD+ synthase (glutamine-hydrolysing)